MAMNLKRPVMTERYISCSPKLRFLFNSYRCEFSVVNGRHPTVELGLLISGRLFVPNSVVMDESSSLHVITGPNMAGERF